MSNHFEFIGTEWEDRDPREEGRVVQLVAIEPNLSDGYGGPVFRAVCIENRRAPKRIGRATMLGLHGLRKRWRMRGDTPNSGSPAGGSDG